MGRRRTAIVFFGAALCLAAMLLVLVRVGPARAQERRSYSLLLQWLPQAQFAGYYAAEAQGLYALHGLEVTLLPGGPDKVVSDYLEDRKTDFGTMFLSTAVERHAAGIPLVNVGQIIRHSALMLIARADRGIETIEDLHHKKVAIWANEFQIQPRTMFREAGVDVEFVPLASSMALFMHEAVAATSGMLYNEYHTILSYGLRESDLKVFPFKDTEYDFPEDGIYCLRSTFERDPAAVRDLLAATLEGWRWAFAHPEEALDIVKERMEEAHLPFNLVHQRWMLERMREVIMPADGSPPDGVLSRKMFSRVSRLLRKSDFIRTEVDYSQFYKGPTHAD